MNILVVDDHNLFLQGLTSILREKLGAAEIHRFADTKSAFLATKDMEVDLAICDLYMPSFQGDNLLELYLKNNLMVPVLLLSASNDLNLIQTQLRLGAAGFIHKGASADALLAAINEVLTTGMYVNHALNDQLQEDQVNLNSVLTTRQKEVLNLLATGLSNRKIGERLGIKETTVKTHVSAVFDYFGVTNRLDCILSAKNMGILSSET